MPHICGSELKIDIRIKKPTPIIISFYICTYNRCLLNLIKSRIMKEKIPIMVNKLLWITKEASFAVFGKYNRDKENDELTVTRTMKEYDFYCLYLTLVNLTLAEKLTESQIIILATLMTKNSDYTLSVDGKGNRILELTDELGGMSKNTVSSGVKRLKDCGYIVENEDRMLVLSAKFQNVRGVVKKQIEDKGFAEYDYLFKCFIS